MIRYSICSVSFHLCAKEKSGAKKERKKYKQQNGKTNWRQNKFPTREFTI